MSQTAPFTLLFTLYDSKLLSNVQGWKSLDITKQCDYLKLSKIENKAGRKHIVNQLIEKENGFTELGSKSYLRIHLKYILAQYYRETYATLRSTNISSWCKHEFFLSFINHLIEFVNKAQNQKAKSIQKVWQFAEYVRKYFDEEQYNGIMFLESYNNQNMDNDNKMNKMKSGFGLKMMKAVCSKYHLKSGPYSKVKKQCNIWAQHVNNQSLGTLKDGIKPINHQYIHNQYESIVAHSIINNNTQHNTQLIVSKSNNNNNNNNDIDIDIDDNWNVNNTLVWYWLSDDNNSGYEWKPYQSIDLQLLNRGWRNKEQTVYIMSGSYRVEFDRSNPSNPTGNQFNNNVKNPTSRNVICSPPINKIHGIPVQLSQNK